MKRHDGKDYKINKVVIGISAVIFGSIFVLGIVNPLIFTSLLSSIVNFLCDQLGWFLNLAVIFSIGMSLFFLFSKYGKTKIGGKDAKPEFSKFTWWAISLCAGMGMGIVFWPPAEIIEYSFNPAVGSNLKAGGFEALSRAFEFTYLHWTLTLYGVYVAAGLVAAYVYYNLKQPYSIASTLYPLFGKKVYRYRNLIDGIVTFAIIGGVAGSFGYGILQVSDGLHQLFGLPTGAMMWILIAIIVTIVYTLSSVTGLKKGIQWLGDNNAKLFIGMLAFVIIFGPTKFSMNLGVETTGNMFTNLFKNLTFSEPFQSAEKWSVWWNWLWYLDFFVFAPTTGLFLARLSKGRTMREFVTVNMVAPCLFGWLWVVIFGGLAAHAQYVQNIDLYGLIQKSGYEAVMLSLFDQLPMPTISKLIMMVVILISFITLANAVTSTISKMSIKLGPNYLEDDAPASVQIFWGIFIGAIAIIFLLNGGLDGAKTVKMLVGFPIVILQVLAGIGFVKMFAKGEYKEKKVIEDDVLEKEMIEENIIGEIQLD
ncbi:BCCT family transporter [Clostridium sediminicola]|uniref:BCCT family transporter n=1 Tax=Clostridium sediminicola TaxID=3114879 RepID=UPI0031F1E022